MGTAISRATDRNCSARKVNVYYVDNLPEEAQISDVYDHFGTFNIYSIRLIDTKSVTTFQSGWIMLEEPNKNINSFGAEKLMGRNLNLRLMGYLFPFTEPEQVMPNEIIYTKGGLKMNMTDVQRKAKKMGLKPGKSKKADLIRKIQAEEGNSICFQMNDNSCDQSDCCWRDDCLT